MNQQAGIDDNFVKTLLGVSNADGKSTVKIWADPITHRLLVDTVSFTGAGAPGTTPTSVGQMYVDTAGGKVYVSVATVNSGSWALLN